MPRAKPEPREVPNVRVGSGEAVGAGALAGISAATGATGVAGTMAGSDGAAAGVPDVSVSDMVVCFFVVQALTTRRAGTAAMIGAGGASRCALDANPKGRLSGAGGVSATANSTH